MMMRGGHPLMRGYSDALIPAILLEVSEASSRDSDLGFPGRRLYGWTEAWMDDYGTTLPHPSGRWGTPASAPAFEANENPAPVNSLVWLRLAADRDRPCYEFYTPSADRSNSTINYDTDVFNITNSTVNVSDTDYFFSNVNVNILADTFLYFNGPGAVIVNAPWKFYGGVWVHWRTRIPDSPQQDDWNIAPEPGEDYASDRVAVRVELSGSATITGAVATPDGGSGQLMFWMNVDEEESFTLAHEHAGSLAANRFLCPEGADLEVPPLSGVWLWHDESSEDEGEWRWRLIVVCCGTGGGGGGTPTLANDSAYLSGTYTLTGTLTPVGTTVFLPNVGRYQLTYTVEMTVGGGSFSGALGGCDLLDATSVPNVTVPNSDYGLLGVGISQSNTVTSTVVTYYDVVGTVPVEIRLRAAITTFDGSGGIAHANLLALQIA